METEVVDKINLIGGFVVTIMSTVFGERWVLFAGFLLLNIIDYATGWYRSRKFRNISSDIGRAGIAKKVAYWGVIVVAFLIPVLCIEIGNSINVDLNFTFMFGWFTLACYIVNELRSILENMVESGVNVPQFLIDGLKVTEKIIRKQTDNKEVSDVEKGD